MSKRVCRRPGCGVLVDRSARDGLCDEDRRARDRARPTARQRGYGPEHAALRASYQRRMNRGEAFTCWRCGDSIDPEHWHLGHDDVDRSVYRGPECVPCNTAVAGR